jgi:hypothetical protein
MPVRDVGGQGSRRARRRHRGPAGALARMGGEEFAGLLPGTTPDDDARGRRAGAPRGPAVRRPRGRERGGDHGFGRGGALHDGGEESPGLYARTRRCTPPSGRDATGSPHGPTARSPSWNAPATWCSHSRSTAPSRVRPHSARELVHRFRDAVQGMSAPYVEALPGISVQTVNRCRAGQDGAQTANLGDCGSIWPDWTRASLPAGRSRH